MAYIKLQAMTARSVTPSDTANINTTADAVTPNQNFGCTLYVGTGGTLRVTTVGGDDVTFQNIVSGTFLPVQVVKVWQAGTSALNILALW
jgi:hypothetical protein